MKLFPPLPMHAQHPATSTTRLPTPSHLYYHSSLPCPTNLPELALHSLAPEESVMSQPTTAARCAIFIFSHLLSSCYFNRPLNDGTWVKIGGRSPPRSRQEKDNGAILKKKRSVCMRAKIHHLKNPLPISLIPPLQARHVPSKSSFLCWRTH